MKGIIFCIVLCSVSLNAMPSDLNNRLRLIEGLRRRGGAATIGEEIAGGTAGSISTAIAAIAGLGLKVLEGIGGGIIGIGDRTASGLITGLNNVGHLRRSQQPHPTVKEILDSTQRLHGLRKRGDIIPLALLNGLRRKGGAATLGEEITGGVTKSISTTIAAIAGLGLKVIEAIGGGIVGIGDKTASGVITGLQEVGNLRRRLRSESDDLDIDEPWIVPEDPLVHYPDITGTIHLDLDDVKMHDSGLGVLGIGDIDTGDVGIAGLGKVNDITVN